MYLVKNETQLASDLGSPDRLFLQVIAERFRNPAEHGITLRAGDLRPATRADFEAFRVTVPPGF